MSDIHLPTTAASEAGTLSGSAAPTTIPEVLRRAAGVVLKRGYANGYRHADDFAVHRGDAQRLGSVCAIGAVEDALDIDWVEDKPLAMASLNTLAKHIQSRVIAGGEPITIVAGWSNSLIRWLGSKEAAGAALARTFEAAADALEGQAAMWKERNR